MHPSSILGEASNFQFVWAQNEMKNAIVVCATPNWLAPAAVTLLSCAQQGAEKFADLLIVCPNPGSDEQAKLKDFNAHHNFNIKLLDVEPSELQSIESGRLGVGALLRLKLDQFLSHQFDRVLYLDSDVIALAPIEKLFQMDMKGMPFAAVESIAMLPLLNRKAKAHLRSINLDLTQPYFNSGVILFDWQATLKAKILPRCLDILKSRDSWKYHDQDTLNMVSNGQWKMLDHKWNVTKKTADYLNITPVFRHFNGTAKPWNSKPRLGFAQYHKYYVESLHETPWQSFMDQPQKPWSLKDNWRAFIRKLSFRKISKLRKHISLVAENP